MLISLFRRHRLAAVLIALTLTGGLGASIALVTVVDVLLWRGPQGVANPERLFVSSGTSNYIEFRALTAGVQSAQLAAVSRVDLAVGSGAGVAEIGFECVTANYFDLLGVRPQRGRGFGAGAGDEGNVIIDDGLWRRMGQPPLQAPLVLDGRTYSVIGVMPRGFSGFRLPPVAGWLALEASPEACSFTGTNLLRSADSWWLDLIGRLTPATSLLQANGEIANVLRESRPDFDDDKQPLVIQPLEAAQAQALGLIARTAWWVTAGAATLVLVVVLNVSSLYGLVWLRRRRDAAVCLLLGADRWRMAAAALREMATVVAVCTPITLLVAGGLAAMLAEYFPVSVSTDSWTARSALIAFGLSAVVAVCASVGPMLHVLRLDTAVVQGAGLLVTDAPGSTRVRTAVVTMQIALALALTIVAYMFATSVSWLGTGSGYEMAELVLIGPRAMQSSNGSNDLAMLEASQARLKGLAVVESTTLGAAILPNLNGAVRKTTVRPAGSQQSVSVFLNVIEPQYFATAGTRLLSGRDFHSSDRAGNEAVGIISRVTAQRLWPSGDALGSSLEVGRSRSVRIVGVSESRRAWRLTAATDELFLPASQFASMDRGWSPTSLLVRTNGPAEQSLAAIHQVIGGVDQGRLKVGALSDLAGSQIKGWRTGATLFGAFGWVSLVLSALGVYATFALYVLERTAELAIRVACGAGPRQLASLLVRRSLFVVIPGIAIGSAIAYGSTLATRSMWFGTAPGDPSAVGFAAVVVIVAAALGIMAPTIVAMRSDPSMLSRIG